MQVRPHGSPESCRYLIRTSVPAPNDGDLPRSGPTSGVQIRVDGPPRADDVVALVAMCARGQPGDTAHVKLYLNALEVAELAELLEDAPVRAGVVDQVLQAAAERRGMALVLADCGAGAGPGKSARHGRRSASTGRVSR